MIETDEKYEKWDLSIQPRKRWFDLHVRDLWQYREGDSQVETSHSFSEMPEKYLKQELESLVGAPVNVVTIGSWGWRTDQQNTFHLSSTLRALTPHIMKRVAGLIAERLRGTIPVEPRLVEQASDTR